MRRILRHSYSHDITVFVMGCCSLFAGGVGSICSSKTASSAEYCHGTVGDGNNDNGIAARYDVDDYYCSSVETKPLRDARIVSSSHTVNGNSTAGISGFLLTSVTSGVVAAAPETLMVGVEESDGDNLTAKSEASDRGMFAHFFIVRIRIRIGVA